VAFTVQITRTTPVYRNPQTTGVFVQWTVSNAPSTAILFKLERSGSPEGPFELVIDLLDSYHFFDDLRATPPPASTDIRENLNFLSLSRGVSYRVTATAGSDTAEDVFTVGATAQSRKIALLNRKMQRDASVGFKFNGIALALLKRRHWGTRCTDCFDALTKTVTDSKCTTCYGTGITAGYFDPIRVRGRIGVKNVQTTMTQHGKSDRLQRSLTILAYPELEVDDIVVDIAQNERYTILARHSTELQTVAVHQNLILSDLTRDSIEYRIPVNVDHTPVIY